MPQPLRPEWRNTDPRSDCVDMNDVEIVVLRPHPAGRGAWEAGVGHAEMKHGWSVVTSFENHRIVGEGDTWDPGWFWVRAPVR